MLFRSDRKSTRLNSSHTIISYAVFCLKKKNNTRQPGERSAIEPGRGGAVQRPLSRPPVLPGAVLNFPRPPLHRLCLRLFFFSRNRPPPVSPPPPPPPPHPV